MTLYNYEIGSSSTTTNLENLTVPVTPPKSSWLGYSRNLDLGDGKKRGMGWQRALWHWGFLTEDQYDQLKTFCTGSSAEIWIRTRTNDNSSEYVYRTGILVWPDEESIEKDAGKFLDISLEFRKLEAFTPA